MPILRHGVTPTHTAKAALLAEPSNFAGDVYLEIPGPPRTKKTSNQIVYRRDKLGRNRPRVLPSEAFLKWQEAAAWHLRSLRARHAWPLRGALSVRAYFFCDVDEATAESEGDPSGYYQALADCLQHAGVIVNDCQIRHWDGSRVLRDRKKPRIELTITAERPYAAIQSTQRTANARNGH